MDVNEFYVKDDYFFLSELQKLRDKSCKMLETLAPSWSHDMGLTYIHK